MQKGWMSMISIPKNVVYQLIPLTSDLYTFGGHLRAYDGLMFRHISPKDVSDIRSYEKSFKNKILAMLNKHEILEVYRASSFDLQIKFSVSSMSETGLDQINVELYATVNISNIIALTSSIMGDQSITIEDVGNAMQSKLYAMMLNLVSEGENSHDICQAVQYMHRTELEDVFASIGLSVSKVSIQAYSTLEAERRKREEDARIEDEQRLRELIYELKQKVIIDPVVLMESINKLSENPMFDINSYIQVIKTVQDHNQYCLRFLTEQCSRYELPDRSDNVIELLHNADSQDDYSSQIVR